MKTTRNMNGKRGAGDCDCFLFLLVLDGGVDEASVSLLTGGAVITGGRDVNRC